jgi:hypothetical protein
MERGTAITAELINKRESGNVEGRGRDKRHKKNKRGTYFSLHLIANALILNWKNILSITMKTLRVTIT